MAIPAAAATALWTDFYERNKGDGGPFQTLFETNTRALTAKTTKHTSSVNKLTESITGSGYGNMMLVPGEPGRVQVIHHGFATETNGEFALVFIQGNLTDGSIFKVLPRDEVVEPIAEFPEDEDDADGAQGVAARNAPGYLSLIEVDNAQDFGELLPEENEVLMNLPNHFLIHPKVFALTLGARSIPSRDLAFAIIRRIIGPFTEGENELDDDEDAAGRDYEGLLAWLWAVENGLLPEIRLQDVPETEAMNNLIKGVRAKVNGTGEGGSNRSNNQTPGGRMGELDDGTMRAGTEEAHRASIEMMASSSQAMAAIMNRMQEGNDIDRNRKEAERSLLKTMGPTQRELFTSLCTTRMSREPHMSTFMTGLTMSKTPQKAINLLLAETRDWEGTFSVGGFHKMLSHGLMNHETNRANPGGFTIFMFHPKTVELGGGKAGNNSNELLREYLGMDIEEETLEYYAKQGFYIPSNPNDMRIQLQTARNTLELLTCDNSIATKGLAYILEPGRWARLLTNMNDRFRSEPEFGTKFCYTTLDRHLQLFFDKMTRWEDVSNEGETNYLLTKAEALVERIEDGRGLNIVLPTVLKGKGRVETESHKRGAPTTKATEGKRAKKSGDESPGPESKQHPNTGLVPEWALPAGSTFKELMLKVKARGVNEWPKLLDRRIPPKSNQSQMAPLCLKFQVTGSCKKVPIGTRPSTRHVRTRTRDNQRPIR